MVHLLEENREASRISYPKSMILILGREGCLGIRVDLSVPECTNRIKDEHDTLYNLWPCFDRLFVASLWSFSMIGELQLTRRSFEALGLIRKNDQGQQHLELLAVSLPASLEPHPASHVLTSPYHDA